MRRVIEILLAISMMSIFSYAQDTTNTLNGQVEINGQTDIFKSISILDNPADLNRYDNVDGTCKGLVLDETAKPLQTCFNTDSVNTPSPGKTFLLKTGCSTYPCPTDIATAYANASCGDVIMLQAGQVWDYTKHQLILKFKSCDSAHYISLRTSSPDNLLPDMNTTITPCWQNVTSLPGRNPYPCPVGGPQTLMATIKVATSNSIIFNADHIKMTGLEIMTDNVLGQTTQLTDIGISHDIIFDRNWFHGTRLGETRRAVALSQSYRFAFINNYVSDMHCISNGVCNQSQTIGGGIGAQNLVSDLTKCQQGNSIEGCPRTYKIVNNYLESAGEGMLFGGSSSNFTPTDFEIRRNRLFKPRDWDQNCATNPLGCGPTGVFLGTKFVVINCFELKNASRVLFQGNVCENNWGGFSQQGYAVLLTVKNQGGGCPLCYVSDVQVKDDLFVGIPAGIQLAGVLDDNGFSVALGTDDISVHDIITDKVFTDPLSSSIALEFTFNCNEYMRNIAFNHITFSKVLHAAYIVGTSQGTCQMNGVKFNNSIIDASIYPMTVTSDKTGCQQSKLHTPLAIFDACFSPYTFQNNAVLNYTGTWPPLKATFHGTATPFVNFNNGMGGDYHVTPASGLKNAGTDGKDIGADIDEVMREISGIL